MIERDLAPPAQPDAITSNEVRAIIRSRQLRAAYLGDDLFADAAWDMMLDLYAAYIEGKRVSVSSLCSASGVPPTTALRWIRTLEQKALVLREPDPLDGRRIYLELAPDAAAKMSQLLHQARTISNVLI